MTAVIVDDERLARAELRRLLRAHPDVTVIGEAASGPDAISLLAGVRPDVLFLDIAMPAMTGFEVLERLTDVPSVVFTTAYDVHAIKAFEIDAVDYLLKPIAPARLATALGRIARIQNPPTPARSPVRVFVRDGDRCWIVKWADVMLLESEGNYTRLHFGTERPLVRRSLAALIAPLDPAVYVRANRAQVVNLPWISTTTATVSGGLLITLRNGTSVSFSRREAARLRARLEV
jgi:two-component system, LytTR family, response regulator